MQRFVRPKVSDFAQSTDFKVVYRGTLTEQGEEIMEQQQIFVVLKQQLHAQGKTYAELAKHLHVSESSIKRLFANQSVTLERLLEICQYLQLNFAELARLVDEQRPVLDQLTLAQEKQLMQDPKLILVAVCMMNHWPIEAIIEHYQVDLPECILKLTQLDKMGMLQLLPNNRVRLRVSQQFNWQPNGPIQRYIEEQGIADFFDAHSDEEGHEEILFGHGMLSNDCILTMRTALKKCQQQMAQAHRQSLPVPQSNKRGMAMVLALRTWEPKWFRNLRREMK